MNRYTFPAIEIKPVQRISPSRYFSFRQCALREILSASKQPALLPVSPAARIGSIVHKIIEMASFGKINDSSQFDKLWQEEVSNHESVMKSNPLERHLVPLEETSDDYDVKKYMTRQMIRSFADSGKPKQAKMSVPEAWLETRDMKIGGRIDLIHKTAEGIYLSDYKTGKIIDEIHDSPREEYAIQIKLYAGLFHEVRGEWPKKLLIVGIDQSVHEIAFSPTGCSALVEDARKLLDDTNKMISEGTTPSDFAAPSPEACKYCLFRPGCKKYWQARMDTDDWPLDVIGHIKETGFSGNKMGRLVIEENGKTYTIRALSSRHSVLSKSCDSALVCSLGSDSTRGHYVERLLTTSYII